MEYTFRKMVDNDWTGLYEVEQKAFGGGFSKYFLRMVPEFFGENSFVTEFQGEVIAYCIGVIPNGRQNEGWAMSLGVFPEHQGKGIGKKLLNLTIDSLRSNGAEKIFLTVSPDNAPAKFSYEKRGFKEVGFKKDYYGLGEDRLIMELK